MIVDANGSLLGSVGALAVLVHDHVEFNVGDRTDHRQICITYTGSV